MENYLPQSYKSKRTEKLYLDGEETYRNNVIALTKENWEHHRSIKIDAIRSVDNLIFIVSTGATGISVGTIGYFQGEISVPQALFLLFAWASLFFAILSSGVAHIFNAHNSRLNMDILDDFLLSDFTKPSSNWNMDTSYDSRIVRASHICTFARLFSIGFLILGTLLLFIFGGMLLLSKTAQQTTLNSVHEQQTEIAQPIGDNN